MSDFERLVSDIPAIGLDWHGEVILRNSIANAKHMTRTVREISPVGGNVLVVSAGPSLYRNDTLARVREICDEKPDHWTLVAIDGSYVQCLRAGILPDYVVTLDPHPTRIVRWFGDPDFAKNTEGDDYFARQDLDEAMRTNAEVTNAENMDLVDENMVPLVICSSAPENVVRRTQAFRRYWFAPLVDSPYKVGSLTRTICESTKLPALNTGGTVGTAAVMFAHQVLKAESIAVVGMDLGYHKDTPLERTQSWNMLKDKPNVRDYYPAVMHPVYGECYTDPTYTWYLRNLNALLKASGCSLTNCSGGGALSGWRVWHSTLDEWARA